MDWVDIALYSMVGLVILLLLSMVVCEVYDFLDTNNLPEFRTQAEVMDKEFHPAHTTYMPVSTGKTRTIMPIYHPPRWYAHLKFMDETDINEIEEDVYESIQKRDKIDVSYIEGRYSKDKKITRIGK